MTRWTLVVAFHVSSVYKTIQPWWMACRFTLTQRVLPQGVKFPYLCGQLTTLLGPNLDPKTGPNKDLKKEWKCDPILDPILGPYLAQKWSAIGEFRCCPHMLCKQICDPTAWTWMSTHTFFSLCVPSPVAAVKVWTLCRYWGWDRHQENKWTKWEVCLNSLVKGWNVPNGYNPMHVGTNGDSTLDVFARSEKWIGYPTTPETSKWSSRELEILGGQPTVEIW